MVPFLILFAAVMTLAVYGKRLPMQNVAMIAALLFLTANGVEMLAATTGFPFQACRAIESAAFDFVRWITPLLWIVFLLNARHLAALILKSRRGLGFYGYWLIALSALLTALFWLGLDWATTTGRLWPGFIGRIFTGATMLILIFPWTLNKKPRSG
jgi:uncharacterized membrane protein